MSIARVEPGKRLVTIYEGKFYVEEALQLVAGSTRWLPL